MSSSNEKKNPKPKLIMNNSYEFSKAAKTNQLNINDKINFDLVRKISKIRKHSNESRFTVKNTRRDIAQRIYSKLQNWPIIEKQKNKPLKKFYWTKDFTHCAFTTEDEIVDGYLVKP